MGKEYYITKMSAEVDVLIGEVVVTQLVKASSKDLARKVVKETCLKEYPGATIYEIRVDDTLIGD